MGDPRAQAVHKLQGFGNEGALGHLVFEALKLTQGAAFGLGA